jgi:hypothetical protein
MAQPLIFKLSSEDIVNNFNKYLPIPSTISKEFKRIVTPIELVDEICDKLPKKVWGNPYLKWLNPAVSQGNFFMIVFEKLFLGLKNFKDDKLDLREDDTRKKYIIKNMLYMMDENSYSSLIIKKIFGNKCNFVCENLLEKTWGEKIAVKKFDIILGTPPFKSDKIKSYNYFNFVKELFEVSNPNSFIGILMPSKWRSPKDTKINVWKFLSSLQVNFIHIYGEKDGNKFFKSFTKFDSVIFQNKKYFTHTQIIDEFGNKYKEDLRIFPFLPNYNIIKIKDLFLNEKDGFKLIVGESINLKNFKKKPDEVYKYPYYIKITREENNKNLIFSKTINDKFNTPKVILNENNEVAINDFSKKYGYSNKCFGIQIESKQEGDNISKAHKNKEFIDILKSLKWYTFQTEPRIYEYLKKDFWKDFIKKSKSKSLSSSNNKN